MLVVIRQAVRVLQLFGRQFGSQQTRASSPVPRHDGYKLCRWPIYMAAILANSTRSLFIAEIPTYVHTYVCGPLHSARSIVVREGGWRGEGVKTDSRPTRKILETARQDGRPTKSEERGHATAA